MQPPIIISHQIPPTASKMVKFMQSVYEQLKNEAVAGRWFGVEAKAFNLSYNYNNGDSDLILCLNDEADNEHFFMICLYDDSWGDTGLPDRLTCRYLFKPSRVKALTYSASLSEYIKEHLLTTNENLDFVCDKNHFYINVEQNSVFNTFATMLDLSISKIQSVEKIHTVFRSEFLPKLWDEAAMGRWNGVRPFNFKCSIGDEQTSIYLLFRAARVWNIEMSLTFTNNEDGYFLCSAYEANIYEHLNQAVKDNLTELNNNFLNTLSYKFCDDIRISGESNLHFIQKEIYRFDNSINEYCKMLDIIVPAFQQFTFQLNESRREFSKEMFAIKETLEGMCGTTLEFLTDIKEINRNLSYGKFE